MNWRYCAPGFESFLTLLFFDIDLPSFILAFVFIYIPICINFATCSYKIPLLYSVAYLILNKREIVIGRTRYGLASISGFRTNSITLRKQKNAKERLTVISDPRKMFHMGITINANETEDETCSS